MDNTIWGFCPHHNGTVKVIKAENDGLWHCWHCWEVCADPDECNDETWMLDDVDRDRPFSAYGSDGWPIYRAKDY